MMAEHSRANPDREPAAHMRGTTFHMRFLPVAVMLSALTATSAMHRLSWAAEERGQENRQSGTESPERIPLPIRPKRHDGPLPQKPPEVRLENGHAVLENGFLECSLSLDSGPLITGLENKFISQDIIDGHSRLFLVHQGAKLIGNSRFKRISASVKETDTASSLRTVWRCSDVPLDLDMRIRIDSSPEMSWQATIRNTGLETEVFRVTCPVLEHIRVGDLVRDDLYFYPLESGICGGLDYEFRHAYGFTLSMQIMNVFDPAVGGGVYTFAKDDSGYPKILVLRKMSGAGKARPAYAAIPYPGQDPGRLFDNDRQAGTAMAIHHLEFQLAPGQSARLPEIAVGVHEGDWHDPLRRYSRWAHTWFRKALPTPRWYLDTYTYLSGHRLRGLHLLSQKRDTPGYWDTTRNEFSYSRQMGLAEENSLMEWAYWWRHDQDGRTTPGQVEAATREIPDITLRQYGDYDYDPDLGGVEALRKEVARIHDKKGRLLLYTHYDACWQGTRIGEAHGKEWAQMDRPGQYSTRYLGLNEGWKMCPYISGWRGHFGPLMARRVQETGADGYRLDTGAFMYPCHNPGHDHYDGTARSSLSPKSMGQFLLACQKSVRAVNPEAITTTEHAGSDYLTQFTDGYFSQNLVWVGNPATNKFRSLNQYRIVFTRFYFPEVKTAIHGPQPWSEAVTMGLFNACAPVCMRREGVFRFDAVRENGDAFNSLLEPEPLVDTLVDGLYANYFPGPNKRVWTLYNRTGRRLDGPLIQVPASQGVHYVEVYNDLPVKSLAVGQDLRLSAPVGNEDVICIAQLPQILVAKAKGNAIEVDATRGDARGCTLEVAYDADIPGARTSVPLTAGKATVTLPEPLPAKAILKLMKGYYLVDETVLFFEPAAK